MIIFLRLIVRYPQLKNVYENPNTFVLYPSETAISLNEFRSIIEESEANAVNVGSNSDNDNIFHVILIDGTWSQASGIYYTNLELHKLKQVVFFCCC